MSSFSVLQENDDNNGRFDYNFNGNTNKTPLAKALQGDVCCALDTKSGKLCVIKRADKYQVMCHKAADNMTFVQENIDREAKLLKDISKMATKISNLDSNENKGEEKESSNKTTRVIMNEKVGTSGFCMYLDYWTDCSNHYLATEHGGINYISFINCLKKFCLNKQISYGECCSIIRYQFKQMANTMYFFHKIAEIAHNDLSLENLVVDDFGNVKIIDFGLATKSNEGLNKHCFEDVDDNNNNSNNNNGKEEKWKSDKYVGKTNYQSPEVRNLWKYRVTNTHTENVGSNEWFDMRSNDMWCLGIKLLRMMLLGDFLWKIDEDKIMEKNKYAFEKVVIKKQLMDYLKNDLNHVAIDNKAWNSTCCVLGVGMCL